MNIYSQIRNMSTFISGYIGSLLPRILKRKKLLIVILMTLVSCIVLLPSPWSKFRPYFWGTSIDGTRLINVDRSVYFETMAFNLLESFIKIPGDAKYYNAYFLNKYRLDLYPLCDDLSMRVMLRKDSAFGQIVARDNSPTYQDDTVYYFDIPAGKGVTTRMIPIDIPMSYSIIPTSKSYLPTMHIMGSKSLGGCPNFDFTDEELNQGGAAMEVYATPNLPSLLIRLVIILSFWVVFVNSLLELVRIDCPRGNGDK